MAKFLDKVMGPKIPPDELARNGARYRTPTVIFTFARIALLISIFVPYWSMRLEAPQYPDGLHVSAYVNRLTGDVKEIDGLNHYIGMRPLEEAAQLERSLSIWAIIALMFLVEGAVVIRTHWAAVLLLPAILFPPFFLLDLFFWLSNFGQNLDPAAPLSGAIDPFTPPVLGTGVIGQFKTIARPGPGLILASIASVLLIAGLFFHRRAFKPLVDRETAGA
ncbi:MAG: cytochrome C [Planctomycetes bacterium]|nr:cytochrome C [Planctomycetota bacterium]